MSKRFFKLVLILAATGFLVSACSFPWQKKPTLPVSSAPAASSTTETAAAAPVYTEQLKKFNNYQEVAQFLSDNNNPESNFSSLAVVAPASGTASTTDNTPNNYLGSAALSAAASGIQPDIIKTDGTYVYTLTRDELSIIKIATSGEASAVSQIIFKSRPQAMFLSGNFLAVYGLDTQLSNQPIYQTFARQNPYTFFKVFDVSDPVNPKLTRDLDFEGNYLEARLIGDYVYFISTAPGLYLADEPVLPRVLDNGQVLSTRCDGAAKCFAPDVFYFDVPYDSYSFVSVTAINLQDNTEAISGQVYLADAGQNFYLTPNNLYVSYTPPVDAYSLEQQAKRALLYPVLAAADQAQIKQIEASSNFILNNNEKKIKVTQILDRYLNSLAASDQSNWQTAIASSTQAKLTTATAAASQTFIYKMSIKGSQLAYQAFGQVPGQVLGRSALDEDGDYLRLVTVNSPGASGANPAANYNNVYVLGPDLQTVGSLPNLVTTAATNYVRFLGNRVYLVPTQAADPLAIVSLNDPTKPAALRAVQIPGTDNYLQPLDANGNQFIVLSRNGQINYNDGTSDAGLTLSSFDLTNLDKPQEISSYLIGGSATSTSIAFTDRRALFYSPDKNLLSLPVALSDDNGRLNFSGVLAFDTSNDKLNLQGKIDHSAAGHFTQPDTEGNFNYYDNTVKRSWLLNSSLMTFSNKFLKLNNWPSLSATASLELTTVGDDYMIRSGSGSDLASSTPVLNNNASSTAPDLSGATSTPNNLGTSTPNNLGTSTTP